ncbi:RNA polymerase sigma factor [Paenibacillus lutrae]|uniref:Sigma-70 family RNA polymerase sigma factor n=1 Tax=Paenibacillus lutrae TaxID=2078573 RepID=A0A7X3FFQ0_9BACL|nr:sigma-70 family RNA polymerase sigma factor [Paenibacillus lutrae]MVO98653.1 sigma-70 family RNA polymerase sigma factor [Paenibacillus lutrae]
METEYLKDIDDVDSTELYNLMNQYGDDVWRYAYAITKNKEQSKDIAQEVFIKVHSHLHTYRGQSSFKTWLFAITRNIAINEMRSGYFRKVLLFGNVRNTRTEQSAEGTYIGIQGAAVIRSIIMGLSRKLREVLILDLDHELTIQEMADVLGIPQGTVKSRLNRARKKVEKIWREMENE